MTGNGEISIDRYFLRKKKFYLMHWFHMDCKFLCWATRDSARIPTFAAICGQWAHFGSQKTDASTKLKLANYNSNGGPNNSTNKRNHDKNSSLCDRMDPILKHSEARFLIKLFITERFGAPCVYDYSLQKRHIHSIH